MRSLNDSASPSAPDEARAPRERDRGGHVPEIDRIGRDGGSAPLTTRTRQREAVIAAVARGAVLDDESFDALYPRVVQRVSGRHWTPFPVVLRALAMLEIDEDSRVLDVGSGPGKFCLIGAMRTRAHFVGVEQRRPLVRLARAVARRYRVERASYWLGDVERIDWTRFNRLYFYNPFGECHVETDEQIPFEADLSHERFRRLVRVARLKLACLPVGTRVVTFHGLGGPMPSGYRCVAAEAWNDGLLKCWVRDNQAGSRRDADDPFEDISEMLSPEPRRG